MKRLGRASDALLLLAIVFLVVALAGPSWAYAVAAVLLAASVALTVARRRVRAARRDQPQT